ncbi:hypothetical protein Bca52824_017516 [Brassica carinata]|uniref:Uncharacterized protein n=1 Tax=Brassica carinata TaxID=52824 RepID=A0A8X8AVG7_BRACI|nr:hypothetical protein Bca52824_017516 [Brassica carinata]
MSKSYSAAGGKTIKMVFVDTKRDKIHSSIKIQTDVSSEFSFRASLEELYELWRQRIEKRTPFQYVVGCEHWRDLGLCVEEGVLIPRPETEMIVDMVEEVVARDERFKSGTWADFGTGNFSSMAVMAGMASEGTQYDPRQFDTKMNAILGEEGQETFYTTHLVYMEHGAGFRGSCVAFVDAEKAEEAASYVKDEYEKAQPEFAKKLSGGKPVLNCEAGDSAARVL